jgi:CheY-like chemotaxis protein
MGKRVLVVEDSADVRMLLSELLGAHGYVVTGAATGTEGIAAALHSPPDLILVDLCLPDDDGLSVARTLLSDAALAGVPVLTISAYDAVHLRAEALEAGCAGYAVKPFEPERLLETVRHLIGG